MCDDAERVNMQVSSLMALINGALKQQDAPLLGTPLATFYGNKTLFRDVVSGDNNNDGFSGDWCVAVLSLVPSLALT
jgi:hypothetical protein